MHSSAHNAYLEAGVLTATPQKLHLMLVEAALRAARQAREAWQRDQDAEARAALTHCQKLVGEMLASLRGSQSEFAARLVGVYAFMFRRVTEAHLHRDTALLDEAIRILEVERETWQTVCEKFGSEVAAEAGGETPLDRTGEDDGATGGLSLEA